MASDVVAAVKRLQAESPLTETELAGLMGCSPQSMHNALSAGVRRDMYVGRAAEILVHLGYGVALVPLGKKLPEGCIPVHPAGGNEEGHARIGDAHGRQEAPNVHDVSGNGE